MRNKIWFYLVIVISLLYSCAKDNKDAGKLPEIASTASVTEITSTTAYFQGEVISDGGSNLTATGSCWSIGLTPTISDNKTNNGTYLGVFKSALTNLTPGTTYNIRAYAINSKGTAYGSIQSFTTREVVTDIDGNIYNTVTIGAQTWMVENLRTTKYNDGTPIPLFTDQTTWPFIKTAAYCWYNNDPGSYKNDYGALYNWYSVNTGKLAPIGWHVPSISDVNVLIAFTADKGLKEAGTAHWKSPNIGIGNKYGFSALPGGWGNGGFVHLTEAGMWWTTSTMGPYSQSFALSSSGDNVNIMAEEANFGFSVRCIKN